MATRNVVPRADAEGTIGTTLKRWINAFLSSFIEMGEITTPANPDANRLKLYAKDDGGGATKLYILDSVGEETDLTGSEGGGGGGNEYIEVPTQLGVPSGDLWIVDVRQGSSWVNPCHTWIERRAVSTTNTSSDILFKVQLPSDFDTFHVGNNIFVNMYCNARVTNTCVMYVYRDNGTVDGGVNGANIEPSADATWEEITDQLTGTYAAGEWIYIRINVNLDAGAYYRIGEMYLRYNKA